MKFKMETYSASLRTQSMFPLSVAAKIAVLPELVLALISAPLLIKSWTVSKKIIVVVLVVVVVVVVVVVIVVNIFIVVVVVLVVLFVVVVGVLIVVIITGVVAVVVMLCDLELGGLTIYQ